MSAHGWATLHLMRLFELFLVAVWILTLARTVLNLLLVPRLRPGDALPSGTELPLVSVVIPARDEERAIEATVRGFLAQSWPRIEVIVVNDRSVDRTEEILSSIAAADPRLRVVHGDDPPPGWLGKPWAIEQGSRRAAGEFLLIVDADVHYAPGGVQAMVERVTMSGADMVSLLPHVRMQGFWEHVAMPMLAFAGMSLIPTFVGNRTTIPLLGIGGGTGMLVKRSAFDDVGGYGVVGDAVIDDIGFSRALRRRGHRTEILIGDEIASLRMYHGGREIVDGFTKNLFSGMERSYVLALLAITALVAVHIVPYALALRGDTLAIVAVALITVVRLLLYGSLRYRLDNALFMHPVMMAFWTWICIRSMWKTGVRKQLHWRGRTYHKEWGHYGKR